MQFSVILAAAAALLLQITSTSASAPTQATFSSDLIPFLFTESPNSTLFASSCSASLKSANNSDTVCGDRAIITRYGVHPINMWPNQTLQASKEGCATYCQRRIGDYYESFSAQYTNVTGVGGYACSCFDWRSGSLGLNKTTRGAFYFDSSCFSYQNC